jgi:threonylcarbamoyladenosine tRNA methylthiotransferase MtaB
MPQVRGEAIRERAARLRAAGDRAQARHFEALVGQRSQVLMESPRMGRTETFAEVTFAEDQPVGAIVATRLAGVAGGQLDGVPA